MAKEHTTIGLNRSTMALAGLVIAMLAAGAFWNDRGGSHASAAAAINQGVSSNTSRNDTQDEQIAIVRKDIKEVTEEQHKAEIARVQIVKDIGQTKKDVGEIKDDFKELKHYLMQYDYKSKKEND